MSAAKHIATWLRTRATDPRLSPPMASLMVSAADLTEMSESRADKAESELEKVSNALKLCVDALSLCYDVNDWPADGRTIQDDAIRVGRAALAERSEGEQG